MTVKDFGGSPDGVALAAPRAVLVYSHSWLPGQVDGVAIRMMAHARELTQRGTKVVVATPDFVDWDDRSSGKAAEAPVLHTIPGVEHVTLETDKTPIYRKNLCMRYSINNFRTLVALIHRLQPDYVHGTQEASIQMLAAACLLCDVPLVVSMHTDVTQIAARDEKFSALGGLLGRLHTKLAVFCVNWGYRNWALAAVTYLPVSKHARALLHSAGVPDYRVAPETWGPMVDHSIFRIDLPEDDVAATRKQFTFGLPGTYLMVYVGRVTAEKDVQFLVDALGRAPPNVVLALVGPGSMVAELSKLHGPRHRLYCTGEFVGREDVALALRAADCCVSASTMETIGFTAMEALSCGTPMLAANAQGFAEHLSHGVNARLWTPHDEGSFDGELAELMAAGHSGSWAPESLRASMAAASVDVCTDRALRAYLSAGRANKRALRLTATLSFLVLNWLIGFVIK